MVRKVSELKYDGTSHFQSMTLVSCYKKPLFYPTRMQRSAKQPTTSVWTWKPFQNGCIPLSTSFDAKITAKVLIQVGPLNEIICQYSSNW